MIRGARRSDSSITDLVFRDCILHGNDHDCLGARAPTQAEINALAEPDYEAAWGYARSEDHDARASNEPHDLVVLDKVDVIAAIDAALGGDT